MPKGIPYNIHIKVVHTIIGQKIVYKLTKPHNPEIDSY